MSLSNKQKLVFNVNPSIFYMKFYAAFDAISYFLGQCILCMKQAISRFIRAEIFMIIDFTNLYYFFKNKRRMLKFIISLTNVVINHQKKNQVEKLLRYKTFAYPAMAFIDMLTDT